MNTVARRYAMWLNLLAKIFLFLTCIAFLGPLSSHTFSAPTAAQKEKAAAVSHHAKSAASASVKSATSGKTTTADDGTVSATYNGDETEDDETFAVGNDGATVTLSWNMYQIPDRLELVLPSSDSLQGVPLPPFDYFATGLVQGEGNQTVYIPPGYTSFTVIMNQGGGMDGTLWTYDITVTPGDTSGLTGVGGNPNQIKSDPFDVLRHNLVFDPVDTATGAHVIRRSLLSLGGARPLTFDIDYNSLLGYNGPLGTGWSHNHQVSLQGIANGNILLRWNNKRQNLFQPVSSQPNLLTSSDQEVLFYTLTKNSDGSFILRAKDQTTWNFDSSGRMTSQVSSIGQAIVYAYSGTSTVPITITEPVSGHFFSLTYDSQNILQQVDDNTGRVASFTYSDDLTDRLVGITLTEGTVSQTYVYTYDENGRVLTGTTPEGVTVFQDSYDSEQRIQYQTDANGNTSSFAYDETSQPGFVITTATNRLGKNWVYVSDANYNPISATDPLGNVTSYTYDQNGSRTSVTDPNGHVTQFAYDGNGNPITTTDAANNASSVVYDGSNRPTKITNAAGATETITYDASNRPITTTDFAGNKTTFAYDSNSLLLSQTLPRSGKRQFVYTAGQPTQITDPDGNTSKIAYDAKGRPVAVTDAAGNTSTLSYDINDHVTSRVDPLGDTTSFTYDSRGSLLSQTDPSGATTSFAYDGNKNLSSKQDALGNYITYGYDAEDRPASVQDANGNTSYLGYDDAGRLTSTTDALSNTTTFSYDAAGNRTGVIDALGKQAATTTFDARNLPVAVQDALNRKTTISFDAVGRLASKTDPLNRTTTYSYDPDSRLASVTNPLDQTTAQAFDGDGNLANLADAKQHNTTLTADAAGRLTASVSQLNAITSYGYDPRGLLTQVTTPSKNQSMSVYDAAGRKTSLTDGTGTTTYTYDRNGRLLTTSREGKPITRTYDALGRLTQFSDNGGNSLSYAYDAVGNQTDITYATGLVVHYDYDADNRVSTVTDWNQHQTNYAYDADGRLVTTSRADGSVETRTYDDAGELTKIDDEVGTTPVYTSTRTFDAAGQVSGETTVPEVTPPKAEATEMTYDADNRLASYDGFPTVFDADGNMTVGPLKGKPSKKLRYDSRDQLVFAKGQSYFYDAENYRDGVINANGTTGYICDRSVPLSRLFAKVNPDGSATRYIYGLGLISDDEGGAYRVYHFDARGSTVAITDGSGNLTGTASYAPFGELTERTGTAANTPFLFNGKYGVTTDANGLYYMRARYYNPMIRRFINQDPTLGSPDDGSGLNRFAFANGNPVSMVDPFGLSADEDNNTSLSLPDNIQIPFTFSLDTTDGGLNLGLPSEDQLAADLDGSSYLPSDTTLIQGGILIGSAIAIAVFPIDAPAVAALDAEIIGGTDIALETADYTITKTVANNLATRPYINSSLLVQEIESTGTGVADSSVSGALRYDVPGGYNESQGTYELVIDRNTNTIYHFVFKGGK